MTIEDTLNENQKYRIQQRLKLDFHKELEISKNSSERKKFSKNLKTQLDILVNQLYDDGVMFYGFTIERSNFEIETEDFIKNMWYYTHLRVEDLINFFNEKIELIEFCYISIEFDEKNLMKMKRPNFYGILGVRSLIGQNKSHYNEILKILDDQIDDVKITRLLTLKMIKQHWNFIIKQNNFYFHRFTHYSNFYDEFYGSISDLELQFDRIEHIAFGLDETKSFKYDYIKGIEDCDPDYQTIINYLITIYMIEEKLFLYENNLYKKISNYDVILYGSIDLLRKNNLKIFEELKKKFPQQLNGLKISKIFNQGWEKFFNDIKLNNHYLPILDDFNILKKIE